MTLSSGVITSTSYSVLYLSFQYDDFLLLENFPKRHMSCVLLCALRAVENDDVESNMICAAKHN